MSEVFQATMSSEGATEGATEGIRARLELVGTADTSTLDEVQAAILAMREQARALGVYEVAVDMRRLEFMSSSCFKCLITWLSDLLEQPVASRYRIRFLSDPNKHWQHRSLRALSCFAVDLVTIEA